jgi:acetyl-CoA C-acetyltransferase
MAEAVVVAVARSPIGRAFKGSMVSIRPDDLTVQMIAAALAKVPQLDPADIDDIMLGCGLPGGEQGYNMARVVAIMLGYDTVPGTTITRYCSSSLQTTRMAYHAIKAGEGDVFVSAGVECVSRFAKGSSDGMPDTKNPVFAGAEVRSEETAKGGGEVWHDPRQDGEVPDVYVAMGQTAENVAALRGITRADQDEFAAESHARAMAAVKEGRLGEEIVAVSKTGRDGATMVEQDEGIRPGTTADRLARTRRSTAQRIRPGARQCIMGS